MVSNGHWRIASRRWGEYPGRHADHYFWFYAGELENCRFPIYRTFLRDLQDGISSSRLPILSLAGKKIRRIPFECSLKKCQQRQFSHGGKDVKYQLPNGKHYCPDHLPIMVCWSTNYPQKSFSIKVYKGAELVSLIAREGNNTIVTLDAISLQSFTSYTIEVLTHGDNGENNVFRNSFTTSNLGHFSGRWVSGGHHFTNDIHYYRGKRNVVMRKQIYLDEDLLDAYISIVGLGFYKLYINGKEADTR